MKEAKKYAESKPFEIYCNYGVLTAEKRNIYTYGAQHPTATCSDEMMVKCPENDWFNVCESATGKLIVETAWGWNYQLDEVLQGDEKPSFYAIDEDKKGHRVYLTEV